MTDPDTSQLTRADLKTMTPAQILQARDHGRLNTIYGLPAPTDATGTLSRADVAALAAEKRHADILKARDENRIDYTGLNERANHTDDQNTN